MNKCLRWKRWIAKSSKLSQKYLLEYLSYVTDVTQRERKVKIRNIITTQMYFHNCFKRMSERGFKEVKDEITFPRKVNKNASWWIDGWIRVTSHPANSKWSDWRILLMLINSANLFIASWLRLITNINTSSCFFLHGRWKKKCLRVFFCFNDTSCILRIA